MQNLSKITSFYRGVNFQEELKVKYLDCKRFYYALSQLNLDELVLCITECIINGDLNCLDVYHFIYNTEHFNAILKSLLQCPTHMSLYIPEIYAPFLIHCVDPKFAIVHLKIYHYMSSSYSRNAELFSDHKRLFDLIAKGETNILHLTIEDSSNEDTDIYSFLDLLEVISSEKSKLQCLTLGVLECDSQHEDLLKDAFRTTRLREFCVLDEFATDVFSLFVKNRENYFIILECNDQIGIKRLSIKPAIAKIPFSVWKHYISFFVCFT